MLRNCKILFDNRPHGVFYSGETVTGKVDLLLSSNKICQALMLNVSGAAKCSWSEIHGYGKRRRRVYFTGRESYFETRNNLMAAQHMQVGSSDLVAGKHEFLFTFVIPLNLPSSFEGPYGYIRYMIEIILQRQYKINLCYKICFTVLSHLDLNLMPNVMVPYENALKKTFYFLFSKQGSLFTKIRLPATGYVSGQVISITCEVNNDSKVKIESIKAGLYRITNFICNIPYTSHRTQTLKLARCIAPGVKGKEEKTLELTLSIPSSPPSSTNSNVIQIRYELKITAEVTGLHSDISCLIPITLGTIPLYSIFGRPVESQMPSAPMFNNTELPSAPPKTPEYAGGPSTSTSKLPSAPPETPQYSGAPPAYFDSAPPSYEEVLSENRLQEEHEDWDHSSQFNPKYPVYDFEKIQKYKQIDD